MREAVEAVFHIYRNFRISLFYRNTAGCLSVLLAFTVCGCQSPFWRQISSGGPDIADSVWYRVTYLQVSPSPEIKLSDESYVQSYDASKRNFMPPSCYYRFADGQKVYDDLQNIIYVARPDEIVACTSDMRTLINTRFEHWVNTLSGGTVGFDAIGDGIVLWASTIGAAVGNPVSVPMNALSAIATGSKKILQEDVFTNRSILNVLTQMQTDRVKWDTIIEGRLRATNNSARVCNSSDKHNDRTSSYSSSLSVERVSGKVTTTIEKTTTTSIKPSGSESGASSSMPPYCTLAEAWEDLRSYRDQGSFWNAQRELTANVSAQLASCQAQRLNVKQGTTGTASSNEKATKSPQATATAPCPASSPSASGPKPTSP